MTHTALPWEWKDGFLNGPVGAGFVLRSAVFPNQADAEFIVRACNNFDALVEALEHLMAAGDGVQRKFGHCLWCARKWPYHNPDCQWDTAGVEAEAALAAARGETP